MPFVGEPVQRVRREVTGTDRYGNDTYEDVATELAERAGFDPGGSREPVEVGRDQVVTNPKLYFPDQRPDLREDDAVIVRGERYAIEGDPADWRSPFGSTLGGLVVELQRVEVT
jgi:hypothetical protein